MCIKRCPIVNKSTKLDGSAGCNQGLQYLEKFVSDVFLYAMIPISAALSLVGV